MINKVTEYINKHSMLSVNDRVIVAVSGGPDSICLLHILNSIKKIYNIELYVAHVNHCLRGDESEGDQAYVERFCASLDIPFYSKRIDINEYSKENGVSCETAGREVRYLFFNELAGKLNANKIALAHNANDQAETVLMRLMRGTGIEGLKGIRPIRDNIYIRPILFLSRQEIEEYCKDNNLNPRIDSSNLEIIYNRNKVRLELIPYIQRNFNFNIIDTLNRVSELLAADSELIEELLDIKYNTYAKNEVDRIVLSEAAFSEKAAVLTRIMRRALLSLKGSINNFESTHIYDIISLQKQGTGKKIMLPRNVIAENVYGSIQLYCNNKKDILDNKVNLSKVINIKDIKATEENSETLNINIKELGVLAEFRVISNYKDINLKEGNLIKHFDYDKVKSDIIIRTRKEGDKFIPYGMKGQKKLKDFFMDLKVPKEDRNSVPLLCFGNEIAWVVGYRVSESFKVTRSTNKILQVRVIGRGKQNDK